MTQLESYLAYYTSCQTPKYAVLVTGNWGVGKTFQVKKAIPPTERYYVSLFGLQSTDEVFTEVLAQMFPKTVAVKKATTVPAGAMLSGLTNAILRTQVKTDRTLVFDDLERCGLNIKDTLGVINRYVEYFECRVVVIAHDEKLDQYFQESKEKLFGQTINVEPQIEAAFTDFALSFSAKEGSLLNTYRQEIIDIFNASSAKSLRVLRHVIEDITRLQKILSIDHLANQDALLELVKLFTALNIEVRNGVLKKEDFKNRPNAKLLFHMRNKKKIDNKYVEMPPLLQVAERYPAINIESNILTDEVLIRMLIEGTYVAAEIQEALNASTHFLKPSENPPWKIFINFDKLKDDVVVMAMEKLLSQFRNHEVKNSGEMLHLFSLRFMMSENALIADSFDDVERDCKKYVDTLLKQNEIPALPFDWDISRTMRRAHDHISFWVTDKYHANFESVFSYLLDARRTAMKQSFPKLMPELLQVLETSGSAFFEMIASTHHGKNIYANVPILASIPPKEFLASWMKSDPKNWWDIQMGLQSRYQRGLFQTSLKDELEWAVALREEFQVELVQATGIRRLRLERAQPPQVNA